MAKEFLEEFRHLKGVLVALGFDLGAHGDEDNRGPAGSTHALALYV
jgi:hypothetical protein